MRKACCLLLLLPWTLWAQTVSHINSCTATTANTPASSISCSITGVTAGDLVTACAFWGAAGDAAVTSGAASDGTSSLTGRGLVNDGNAYEQGECFYLLSANAGNRTYTVNFTGASPQYVELVVDTWHTTSGGWAFDASNQAGALTSASVDTGAITTTGTAEVVFFAGKLYDFAATTSNPLINGVAATATSYSPLNTYDNFYYRLPTSPFTSGHATKTYSGTTNWNAVVMAFKVTGGGATKNCTLSLLGAGAC